jgi:putative NADH-flavin reductase
MKIAVFGGTGRTGVPLLKEALDRGLEVKALVRTPAKMNFSGQQLEVIEGDALDENDVRKTVEGTDAVISVLGPAKGSPDSLMKDAAEVITRVM